MPLVGVTITGADDAVDPRDLELISCEYPFVEWGLLFSPKREGWPRYPTKKWVQNLVGPDGVTYMRLSAHLCGACARDTLAGSGKWLLDKGAFRRVQLNGFTDHNCNEDDFVKLAADFPHEFVLQVSREAAVLRAVDVAFEITEAGGHATFLYDPSGGRGIEAREWPRPLRNVPMGYAGGIKPSNVLEVLRAIGSVEIPFWIDMESGVRVDDKFDLNLVRQVLDTVAPAVAK